MSDKEIVAQTMGGKDIIVEHDRLRPGLYKIMFYPGGELPKELQGHWTSKSKAGDAIKLYLARMHREDEERKTKTEEKRAKQEALDLARKLEEEEKVGPEDVMEFNPKPQRGKPEKVTNG